MKYEDSLVVFFFTEIVYEVESTMMSPLPLDLGFFGTFLLGGLVFINNGWEGGSVRMEGWAVGTGLGRGVGTSEWLMT